MKWACLVNALALYLSKPVNELIGMIGHDGSEIIFPDKDDPYCRKAFHPQEIIDVCYKLGYATIIIEKHSLTGLDDSHIRSLRNYYDDISRFDYYLDNENGILTGKRCDGKRHSVIWNQSQRLIIDPNGKQYGLQYFDPEYLFIIKKMA